LYLGVMKGTHTMIIVGHPESSLFLIPEFAHPVQIDVERFD
jgi:hypothetical protein